MKTRVQLIKCDSEVFEKRIAELEAMGFVPDKTIKPKWHQNTVYENPAKLIPFDRVDITVEHDEGKLQELANTPDIELLDKD